MRDGLVAGAVGAVVGGVPSTGHALATGRDPLEASLAAGTILLPGERRNRRLLAAAALTHLSISLLWGVLLAVALPRRRTVLAGSLAGLAIAALDLGVVARRIPRIRRLPLGPQLADHLLYGAAVGTVLALRGDQLHAERIIPAPPPHVFEFLADLRNHWRLDDCFAELDRLEDSLPGRPGGAVELRGPLGISRTVRTSVDSARPPGDNRSGTLAGTADIGHRTHGRVAWRIDPWGPETSRVTLTAALERATLTDRALFTIGRPWLQRTFARVLTHLADAVR